MGNFVRTDLALEIRDDLEKEDILEGATISTKSYRKNNIRETIIEIENEIGEKQFGRPKGKYITIESSMLRNNDESIYEPIVKLLHKHLVDLIGEANKILVIGLGNRGVTPDALGPMVVDNLYITRHLVKEGLVSQVRELSAISPGVMAQTGIETYMILEAIVKEIKPELVIAIDALAAREPTRLGSTIQLCDTGISPGSGVNNNRMRLSEETIGVKVIAIGVPTVISMPAIVGKTIEGMLSSIIDNPEKDMNLDLSEEDKKRLTRNILDEDFEKMFVTPKDVDEAVKRVSFTISEAINRFFEL